jgi:hypothetical protein
VIIAYTPDNLKKGIEKGSDLLNRGNDAVGNVERRVK